MADTDTITFAETASPDEVQRTVFWAELLLANPAARAHMAGFALPPRDYVLPTQGDQPGQTERLVNLATDEEIDDFGE